MPGTVVFIFQPAEENVQGARAMIADGVLRDPAPGAIFAVHTAPLEVGQIGSVEGMALPSYDQVTVTVRGTGDVEQAAGRYAQAIHAASTGREVAPEEFVLAMAGRPHAEGGAWVVTGMVRAGSIATRARAKEAILRNVAEATTSQRLGIAQPELASTFWRAAGAPADVLRAKGEALRSAFTKAKTLTITHPNGTYISFGVDAGRGFTSDGAITPEKVTQGGAAVQTWLPAGELILPAAAGTANGKIVIDKMLWRGKEVRGLTLSYVGGRLTSMSAASNVEELKAAHDAAGGGKDQFAYVDIGLNPETKLPLGSGRVVWTAPGSVTVGLGDNRGFGGTNASDFGLATQLTGATLTADGTTVIDKGTIK